MRSHDTNSATHLLRATKHYKRASAERALAEAASLPNVRTQHDRAAEAWAEMGAALDFIADCTRENETAKDVLSAPAVEE